MVMKQRIFTVIFLWSASMSSFCLSADLSHLERNMNAREPKKCYVNSCGPPFTIQLIPNPPRLDTECFVSVDFVVAYDLFKGYFNYYIKGPGTIHFKGTEDVRPGHPYVKGDHLHQNYTYHLPPYIPAGVPLYGNFTLINDTDQELICGTFFCKFAPKDESVV